MRRAREVKEGDRFGMLVIIDLLDDGQVRCRCDCGKRLTLNRAGNAPRAKSCGCVRRAIPVFESQTRSKYRRPKKNYPLSVIQMIRNAPGKITGRQLARETGMTEANVSLIRRGMSRRDFVDELAAERTKKNPRFPVLVRAAKASRRSTTLNKDSK